MLVRKIKDLKNQLNAPYLIPDFLVTKHIPSLDGWRAVGIITVILGHFRLTLPPDNIFHILLRISVFAHLGVKIFFVLSGFLITTLIIKEKVKNGRINIINFFIRRVLRIFPVLYLFIVVVYLLNIVLDLKLINDNFIGPILYINNFNFLEGTWITNHTWSLAVEEQFYFIWPLLFSSSNVISICIIILLFSPLIGIFCYLYPQYQNYALGPFFNSAHSIFTGALMSLLICKPIIQKKINTFRMFKFNYTILALFLIYVINITSSFGVLGLITLPFGSSIVNMSICYLMLFGILQRKSFLFYLLNSNILVKIGTMSYSLYIWQQLFIIPKGDYPNLANLISFPANIILTFIVAYLSYHYFEKPILKLKNKFSPI